MNLKTVDLRTPSHTHAITRAYSRNWLALYNNPPPSKALEDIADMLVDLSGKTSVDDEHVALVTDSFFEQQQLRIDAIMQRFGVGF